MIEESAKVLAIRDTQLFIQAQPSSACGACHARSACGQGLLSKYFKQEPGQLTIENCIESGESLALKVGDEIIIGIEESTILNGAFFAYLLPLFFVVASAILAQFLNIQSEPLQILVVFLGFVFGLFFTKTIFIGKHRHLKNILPVLLRKVSESRKLPIYQEY
jgi:sigma-E factor negative regulatory protein RseC